MCNEQSDRIRHSYIMIYDFNLSCIYVSTIIYFIINNNIYLEKKIVTPQGASV